MIRKPLTHLSMTAVSMTPVSMTPVSMTTVPLVLLCFAALTAGALRDSTAAPKEPRPAAEAAIIAVLDDI